MSDYPHDGSQRPLHTPEPPDVITARVFACLDACAGMQDPAAEIDKLNLQVESLDVDNDRLREMQTQNLAEISALRANQQVLVDALESLMDWEPEIRDIYYSPKLFDVLDAAREALNKVKETAGD